jgi:heme exporter protein A
MLTISDISYQKNDKKIFENIGFSIGLGCCLILTGANGSGKTSLLKVIAGINKPNSGKILWNEQDIEEFRDEFNADMQYLGHKNFAKPELTVHENLKFFSGISKTEILIPSAVKYFGLEEVLDKKVGKLSAGWKQRILLAKLLCCPATIWLLDEPTNNLDKQGKELLFNLITVRVKEGGIVMVSSHDEMLFPLGSKFCLEDFNQK